MSQDNASDETAVVVSHLKSQVAVLHEHAKELRDGAGRSERGRLLAVVATELEKVRAFIGYNEL